MRCDVRFPAAGTFGTFRSDAHMLHNGRGRSVANDYAEDLLIQTSHSTKLYGVS